MPTHCDFVRMPQPALQSLYEGLRHSLTEIRSILLDTVTYVDKEFKFRSLVHSILQSVKGTKACRLELEHLRVTRGV